MLTRLTTRHFPRWSLTLPGNTIIGVGLRSIIDCGVHRAVQGFYIAIVAGLLFDKKGPIPPLVIGVIMSALGYALMWAAAMGYLGERGATVGWYSVYMFVWSNGSAFYDTVCIGTNVRNFPNDRGRVTGLLKAFMGQYLF